MAFFSDFSFQSFPVLSLFLFISFLLLLCIREFTVPAELRHLPKVPILPLLLSYIRCEAEDVRTRNLILPFADEKNEGVVVVYALGRWMVHALDHKIIRELAQNITQWPKEAPPDKLLLWRFIGSTNIILSNDETWKRHSRVVKAALNRSMPISTFARLGHRLFHQMGNGGLLKWDDLTMRYALDAVGATALGYDFKSIENTDCPFIHQYEAVMDGIASPAYLIFPKLEDWFPRRRVIGLMDDIIGKFQNILENKKLNKGSDMLTYMLENPDMTDQEFRDNLVVFFIAGHDTSAGGLSSLVYYLAKHPQLQQQVRDEVINAIGPTADPTIETLRDLPLLQACIRESLRINTPAVYTVPRLSASPVDVQDSQGRTYRIPAKTSVIFNLYAVNHSQKNWQQPFEFIPQRFMGISEDKSSLYDSNLWLPFGSGPRQCPARNFAMYELRTLATMLLREYTWSLPADSPHFHRPLNAFSPFALSLPRDLYIEFRKRSP